MDSINIRTTQEQLQFYTNFCKEHPEFLTRLGGTKDALWLELANNLNALRGPRRSPSKWRVTLTHWKNQMQSRKRKSLRNAANDGNMNELVPRVSAQLCTDSRESATETSVDIGKEKFIITDLDSKGRNEDDEPKSRLDPANGYSTTDDTEDTEKSTSQLSKQRSTQYQLHFYKHFCKKHPNFEMRKKSTIANEELWKELVSNLNALPGPTRTVKKWRENLSLWQSQVNFRSRRANYERPMESTEKPPIAKPHLKIVDVSSMAEEPENQNSSSEVLALQDVSNDYSTTDDTDNHLLGPRPRENSVSLHEKHIKKELEELSEAVDKPPLEETKRFDDSPTQEQQTPPKRKHVNHNVILRQILRIMKRREEREELAIRQHTETTTALEQLNRTLLMMNETLVKMNQKLDKL